MQPSTPACCASTPCCSTVGSRQNLNVVCRAISPASMPTHTDKHSDVRQRSPPTVMCAEPPESTRYQPDSSGTAPISTTRPQPVRHVLAACRKHLRSALREHVPGVRSCAERSSVPCLP